MNNIDPSTITFLFGLAVNFIGIYAVYDSNRRNNERTRLKTESRLVKIETHLMHIMGKMGVTIRMDGESEDNK